MAFIGYFVLLLRIVDGLSPYDHCNEEEIIYLHGYLRFRTDLDYDITPITNSQPCCKAGSHNPKNESCCFGNISPLPRGERGAESHGCCNVTTYNKRNEECWLDGDSLCNDSKVVVVGHISDHSSNDKSPKLEKYHCCGTNVYNRDTHTCCQETVVPLTPIKGFSSVPELRMVTQCCGNASYDAYHHGCCGGKVYNTTVTGCCKGTVYSYYTSQCCYGIVVQRANGIRYTSRCCGNATYNYRLEICCGEKVYQMSTTGCCRDKKTYDVFNEVCCDGQVVPLATDLQSAMESDSHCCGAISYNYEKFGCCNDSKVYQRGWSGCCYGTIYNKFVSACCYSSLIPLAPDLTYESEREAGCCDIKSINTETSGCCDYEVFNLITHDCCLDSDYKGTLFDKFLNQCYNEQIIPLALELNSSREVRTCDKSLYNPLTHACCETTAENVTILTMVHNVVLLAPGLHNDNVPHAKCCENISYNAHTQVCCLGTLYNKSSSSVRCCSNKPFDSSIHHCCEDTIWPRYEYAYDRCCRNISYNENDEDCCQGQVVLLEYSLRSLTRYDWYRDHYAGCCGRISYNSENSFCSEGHVYDKESHGYCKVVANHAEITSDPSNRTQVSYNKTTHICYQDNLFALMSGLSDENAKCCGQTIYNSNNQGCCCGNVYNKTTHACCRCNIVPLAPGVIADDETNLECCYDVSYNTDTHICCDGNVVPLMAASKERQRCCGRISYDKATHVCCNYAKSIMIDYHRISIKDDRINRNRVLIRKEFAQGRCCGNVFINTATHDCCHKKITSLAPGLTNADKRRARRRCCGYIPYNRRTHSCCRKTVYDRTVKNCCLGNLTQLAEGLKNTRDRLSACCGYRSYNIETHICCKYQLAPRPPGSIDCCGTKPYNTAIYECSKEEVILVKKD